VSDTVTRLTQAFAGRYLVERELGRGGMATVITHFGSWFCRDIPASIPQIAALGDGVRTSAARDGLVINV
jgi:hypothetical protein